MCELAVVAVTCGKSLFLEDTATRGRTLFSELKCQAGDAQPCAPHTLVLCRIRVLPRLDFFIHSSNFTVLRQLLNLRGLE